MTDSKTPQRKFDIDEYREKVKKSLSTLEKTQQPGQKSGIGNKTDVLQAAKNEIYDLVKRGYTVQQIADALSNDVFGILPKTITQIISGKNAKVTGTGSGKIRRSKQDNAEKKSQQTENNSVKSQGIKQDNDEEKSQHTESNSVKSQIKKPVTEISDVE